MIFRMIFAALSSIAMGAGLAHAEATTGSNSPTETCQHLVEAAKTNNFKEFQSATVGYQGKAHADGKMVGKMGPDYLDKIKSITCGEAHAAGDHAFVEAESGAEKRLIPFVNRDGKWKFDMKTYMSFYPASKGKTKSM